MAAASEGRFGLAVDGEAGVLAVLNMLRDELDATMGMCGKTAIAGIDRDALGGVSPLLGVLPAAEGFR